MTSSPLALIIRTAGTNCDRELEHAFRLAGAATEMVHLRRLIDDPIRLQKYDLVGIPGGFSYGDDLGAGRIFALFLRERLYQPLVELVERGAPIIAPCNGFQVLVKMGLLPGPLGKAATGFAGHHGANAGKSGATVAVESSPRRAPNSSDSLGGSQSALAECAVAGAMGAAGWPADEPPTPTVTLAPNAGGRFIDTWVEIEINPDSPCIWTRGLESASHSVSQRESASKRDNGGSRPHRTSTAPPSPRINRLPIAHGEGRFVTDSPATLDALERNNLIALRYTSGPGESGNPNGSVNRIAGICDRAGLIFGLMPHPERYTKWAHHPQFTRLDRTTIEHEEPIGLRMFRNAVEYAAERRR